MHILPSAVIHWIVGLTVVATLSSDVVAQTYVRGCYFTNWAQYRSGIGQYSPSTYVPGMCSHIIYAFATMNTTTNTIAAFDPTDLASWSGGPGQYQLVNNLKQTDPHLKTLLSFGGSSLSYLFSGLVSTQATRATFITSMVAWLRKYNFDGFDIDWEFPQSAADVSNFNAFAQQIRAAFVTEAASSGKAQLLFSAAVSANPTTVTASYNAPTMGQYFDFINVMTYDFHGSWDASTYGTGENSPLYALTNDPDPLFNIQSAINFWAAQGMPKSKIIVGIATYGRGYTLSNPSTQYGIQAPVTSVFPMTPYVVTNGFGAYYELCAMITQGAVPYYSTVQQVPYLVYQKNQWWGYDNEYSVRQKMRWLKANGYGGAFVWTLDFDDFTGTQCGDGKSPLISVIENELAGGNLTNTTPLGNTTTTVPPNTTPTTTTARTTTSLAPKTTTSAPKTTTSNPASCTTTKPATTPTTKPSTTSPGGAFTCTGRADGFYANPASCSSYYQCALGTAYGPLPCGAGLVWNPAATTCDWPRNVPSCTSG